MAVQSHTTNVKKRNVIMRTNLQDLKYDLLKISEPYDGVLWEDNTAESVAKLFNAYLDDMRKWRNIFAYEVGFTRKETSYTFDVNVTLAPGRSPKKLKIHVGIYQSKWKNNLAA